MQRVGDQGAVAAAALLQALVPALLMNICIVGLNQLYDVEIDRVNKPYLPLASGELSKQQGRWIVGLTGAAASNRRTVEQMHQLLHNEHLTRGHLDGQELCTLACVCSLHQPAESAEPHCIRIVYRRGGTGHRRGGGVAAADADAGGQLGAGRPVLDGAALHAVEAQPSAGRSVHPCCAVSCMQLSAVMYALAAQRICDRMHVCLTPSS